MILLLSLLGWIAVQASATEAPDQTLLDAAADQNRAVILFNDALLTMQSAARAAAYQKTSISLDALQADLSAFTERLDELDVAYRPVHQAHGLLMRSREGGEVPGTQSPTMDCISGASPSAILLWGELGAKSACIRILHSSCVSVLYTY